MFTYETSIVQAESEGTCNPKRAAKGYVSGHRKHTEPCKGYESGPIVVPYITPLYNPPFKEFRLQLIWLATELLVPIHRPSPSGLSFSDPSWEPSLQPGDSICKDPSCSPFSLFRFKESTGLTGRVLQLLLSWSPDYCRYFAVSSSMESS